MKRFKIFKHPDGRLQAVKIGFCWPVFFFGIIWILVARLWVAVAVITVITIVHIMIVEPICIPIIYTPLSIRIICGAFGNEWRESKLLSRHFEQQETVIQARSKGEALAIYAGTGGNAQTDVLPNVQTAQIPPDK
jgi:hypothetical protein